MTTGTVDAQTGTISLNGTGSGSGFFAAEAGATLAFSGGTFALNGDLISSNAVLAGATLYGNGSISGVLNWTSGTFGSGNYALTIATNGILILTGTDGGNYVMSESITNAGLVRLEMGNLRIEPPPAPRRRLSRLRLVARPRRRIGRSYSAPPLRRRRSYSAPPAPRDRKSTRL